jgi:hypothetical protein
MLVDEHWLQMRVLRSAEGKARRDRESKTLKSERI